MFCMNARFATFVRITAVRNGQCGVTKDASDQLFPFGFQECRIRGDALDC